MISSNNIYYLFSVKDQYFTDLSIILKKQQRFDRFYGMAYARSSCLTNPVYSHISYISELSTKDIHVDEGFLSSIETEYDVYLSELIMMDRHLMRLPREKRLPLAQAMIQTFLKDIDRYNIQVIIVEGIDDLITFFAAHFARKHQIKFYNAIYVGYGERACLSSHPDCFPPNFENKFQENLLDIRSNSSKKKSIQEELDIYVSQRQKPSYMNFRNVHYRSFNTDDIRKFIKYIKNYYWDKSGFHYEHKPLLMPFRKVTGTIRKHRYLKFIKSNAIQFKELKNKKYIIYPLQLEPESSTLVHGRWFHDQVKVIELIAKNLPADTILIVKEHLPSIGRRPSRLYKKINDYHNVFFIAENVDIYQLIKYSRGVALISSTMGIEALLLNKPVLAFGIRYYNVSCNVFEACDFRNLKDVIQQFLNHQFDVDNALALFKTVIDTTLPTLGMLSHNEYQQSDLNKFADELQKVCFLPSPM